jgi:hypothetical protein
VTFILETPKSPKDPIEQVAAAPIPPPPLIVMGGGEVYPLPASVKTILLIDSFPLKGSVIALAVALVPLVGDEMETVGVLVYPLPSLFKNISLTYPDLYLQLL